MGLDKGSEWSSERAYPVEFGCAGRRIRRLKSVVGQRMVAPHPVDGDSNVQQHIAEPVFVDQIAATLKQADKGGLEVAKPGAVELALNLVELKHAML